jgi:hypothetical protein
MLEELCNISNLSKENKDLLSKIISTAYYEGRVDGAKAIIKNHENNE